MNYSETCPKLCSTNILEQAITIKINEKLSVRMYADTRPHCLETAMLQKGLVLVLNGKELIEEGMGFGVPVIKYEDKTYFSTSAEVFAQKNNSNYSLKKIFFLDAVSRKKIGENSYINDNAYSLIHKLFEKWYLKNKKMYPFSNKIMELRDLAKIKTEFEKVQSRGFVTVDYEILKGKMNVNFNFSGLQLRNSKEVLIINEQGSTFFDTYIDSNGTKLIGNEIGAWDIIHAQEARLLDHKNQTSFKLKRTKGARLFRGWEKTRNRFSWAGLSYSLLPNRGSFKYSLQLEIENI